MYRGLFTALLSYFFVLSVPDCAFKHASAEATRPQLALQLGHSLPIFALKYSPDGALLASGSNDNSVKIWSAQTRELLHTLDSHTAPVRGVAFSPDGKILATGDEDGNLNFWNSQDWSLLRRWPRLDFGVRGLAYSSDGKYFAAACGVRGAGPNEDPRGQLVVWDADTHRVLHKPILPQSLLALAFSPDGLRLAYSCHDGSVAIIETASGVLQTTMQVEHGFPNALAFSPDGRVLAAIDQRSVNLWDTETGALRQKLTDEAIDTVFSMAFSPDGDTLATASSDNRQAAQSNYRIRLWSISRGHAQATFPTRSVTYALDFAPDGSTLATGAAGELHLISLPQGKTSNSAAFGSRRRWIRKVAWSPTGRVLASVGASDGEVLLWDTVTGSLRRTLRGHKQFAQIYTLSFSPEGNSIATSCGDPDGAEILLWNVHSGDIIRRWRAPTQSISALVWSPDGKMIATGSSMESEGNTDTSEDIRLWNAQTGALINTWAGRPGYVASLAFSPDGRVLATAQSGAPWHIGQPGDNAVTLWDVATGKVLHRLTGHRDNITRVDFSHDGKFLASASNDETVRLWNIANGAETRVLNGHSDAVRSVAFSPDGSTLISAGKDNTLRQWSTSTGRVLRVLRSHQSDVMDAQFSPDGRLIASGSRDTTLRLWNANDGRELAAFLTAPQEAEITAPTEEQPTGAPLWLTATPQGYYNCAEGADYLIKWRFGDKLLPFYHFEESYRRPDFLQRIIRGEQVAARPLLLTRVPPAVRILGLAQSGERDGKNLRILIEAADDAPLTHGNFQLYVNSVLMPDNVAKPIVVDGKPIVVDGKPITVDGKAVAVNGKPIIIDGKPITVDGKPITVDGKPMTASGHTEPQLQRVSTYNGESEKTGNIRVSGIADSSSYAFHRLYVLDIPLPREENIVLRVVVSDSEANKSDDGLSLRREEIERVKGDLWLLSVGVSSYRNPLYNIHYAAADARSLARVLTAQQSLHYERVHQNVLCDRDATAKNIRDALNNLKQAKPNDTVMIFLSGHGIQADGKTYFAPWGVFVRDLDGTSLEWSEIVRSLSGIYAKKLLFTDACHSGAKLGSWQATSTQLAEVVRRQSGIVMLASSQSDEFSYEDKELKQGTFSRALVEAFAGKADMDGDGGITLPELSMYVPKRVSERTKGLQNPQLVLVQDFNPQTVLVQIK